MIESLETVSLDLRQVNYFNVCPFRAPAITELAGTDWALAIDRFFLPMLDFLEPPCTLLVGLQAVEELERQRHLDGPPVWLPPPGGRGTPTGGWGTILSPRGRRHPLLAVPHPSHRSPELRTRIWKAVFESAPAPHAWP